MSRYVLHICLLGCLCAVLACNRLPDVPMQMHAPFQQFSSNWVDSLLIEMTTEEKVGQLLFLKSELRDSTAEDSLFNWIAQYQLGGVMLQQLPLGRYIDFIDSIQRRATIPLFTGTEQQLALNRQFSDAIPLPLPATSSAIAVDSIQDELNELYLRQCQVLGINFCFSPTVNFASPQAARYDMQIFENDEESIIHRSSKRLELLQDQKILSVATAFRDLEYKEPQDTSNYVDSLLHRYYNLVHNGLSGMLIDSQIYHIDTFDQMSAGFVERYLQKELDFRGLIVSEVGPKASVAQLIHSGTDIFVVKDSIKEVADYLTRSVEEGLMSRKTLNDKVRKVLLAKAWMGLDSLRPQINMAEADHLLLDRGLQDVNRRLYESSLILAQNANSALPLQKIHQQQFKIATVGKHRFNEFRRVFEKYANFRHYQYKEDEEGQLKALSFKRYRRSTLVIPIDDSIKLDSTRHQAWLNSVKTLSTKNKVIIVNFGNPYNLQHFDTTQVLVHAFELNKTNESQAVQLLFGGVQAEGQLPLALAEHLPFGHTAKSKPITRLAYTAPEEAGIASYKLVGIDAVFKNAIQKGATPGGQVLIAKSGKVIYHKAFGHHSFNKRQAVKTTDLYDLASITKVAATTLAAMKLYEKKQFKMNDRLSKHIDVDKKSDVGRVTFKQLFIHQSGLQSNMPIAPFITIKDTAELACNTYFCKEPHGDFQVKIADSLYMETRWVDSIWQEVFNLSTRRRKRYRYSDVNFNLIQYYIENATKQSIDEYLNTHFYQALNLRRTVFNPLEKFKSEEICPTADDQRWRKQVLDGYVHDEAAALFGGVGGNAGLFSNATDLAVIFQMLLNGGTYGEQRFLDQKTIAYFTKKGHGNHRGLGFDKPAKRRRIVPSYSSQASSASYGHTGFTGPCVWVDPKHDLVYIFIANRVHPDAMNRKLFRNKIRSRIHNIVYEAFDTYKPYALDRSSKPVASQEELQAGM